MKPERPDLTVYLGQTVPIVVDRPLGSSHPRLADLQYPINYGYVPGTLSGDGAEIDAYILGVTEPIAAYSGTVIAVVLRLNDTEDKLVVAPVEHRYSVDEIRELVAFMEDAFDVHIVTTKPD